MRFLFQAITLQKGSVILFIVILTLVISLSISEFANVIIQQQKLNTIENQQIILNKIKNNLLLAANHKLIEYNTLDKIPYNFHIVTRYGRAESNFINQSSLNNANIVYNYKTYRIDLLPDDGYASKLHIYVAVCEDINQTNLKIIPISQLLS